MDTERFDRLATSLAQTRDRRTTLRLLGLALLGVSSAALISEQATAATATARKQGHGHHRPGNGGGGGSDPGQGTCVGGVDACLGNGTPICTCNGGRDTGLCRAQMEGGTVCAIDITQPAQTTCDQCKTNGDCLALGFPPGSSCVVDSG